MLALFYRHSSHGLLYFCGLYGYTLSWTCSVLMEVISKAKELW
jgi:hypothetical protein